MQTNTDIADQPLSFIKQARRAQILRAAAETVAEHGYARTSLARIAQQAGVSKGVVTYHFANKDELLCLLVDEFFSDAWNYMEPRILAQTSAVGQVQEWIASEHEFFGEHRTEFLAMSQILPNHRTESGELAHADELNEETAGLAQILTEGQRTGELRAFDVVAFARIILRASESVLYLWSLQPDLDLRTQTDVLLDFINHAIRADTQARKTT